MIKPASVASTVQASGLKAVAVSAGQATIGMRALAWAMRSVLVLSIVGIIVVVGDLVLNLVRMFTKSKEAEGGMKKLAKSIDDTNKSMGQLSALKTLTDEREVGV